MSHKKCTADLLS